ncbi:MAG: hypothetical protein P4M11_03795 [Candidatus Pacebacteria bacterium]|nr:hypothetical protein [Candidatus Paceibacterota bacterium]
MDKVRSAARLSLGLVITVCGAILLFNWDPSSLARIFHTMSASVEPAKYLIPIHWYFFKFNAALFLFAGIFTIVNNPLAVFLQTVATMMFGLTYDNPFLATKPADKILKCIYILCHGVVVSALMALSDYERAVVAASAPETTAERKDQK